MGFAAIISSSKGEPVTWNKSFSIIETVTEESRLKAHVGRVEVCAVSGWSAAVLVVNPLIHSFLSKIEYGIDEGYAQRIKYCGALPRNVEGAE